MFYNLSRWNDNIDGIVQFALYVRYFDKDTKKLRVDFLQFIPVKEMIENCLVQVLLNSHENIGINLNYLWGQGYDGVSTMQGQFNGVASHYQSKISTRFIFTLQLKFSEFDYIWCV